MARLISQESQQAPSLIYGSFIETLGPLMRIASWLLVCYWVSLFVGTHLPSSQLPEISLSDKLCHVLAFAGLAFLLAWAIPKRANRLLQSFLAVTAIGVAYALIDEWSQRFIPGRVSDALDVAADSLGILFGLAIYLVIRTLCIRISFLRRLLVAVSR